VISLSSKDENINHSPLRRIDSNVIVYRKDSFSSSAGSVPKKEIKMTWSGKNELWKALSRLDSLQDSVTVKELTGKYHAALIKQKINIPFTITRLPQSVSDKGFTIKAPEPNEVAVGFMQPICFRLTLNNTNAYLLKKMWPQILVSLLLIGFTVLSFWILYRNLVRQQKLNQLKNDFIGNITHELKTPIATVSVALEAIRNFDAIKDPEKTKNYLDISTAELQRLNLLVDKVLKLSMFENKEITLQKTTFNVKELVEEVVGTMKLQLERQQATLTINCTGDNFMIEADRLHLSSVVYNLVDNALKYGGPKPEIEIALMAHNGFMELRVTDKGIGIAPEYRKQVFEKFFRVPTGNVHNTKGYGLGLSYVNYILRRHQGFIQVESEPGKGSSFIARFPYRESNEVVYNK
jgi:two-component system, OmpR family, phosphate regulon sensor histidine kinase PhoR